jgi:hypothetical protein
MKATDDIASATVTLDYHGSSMGTHPSGRSDMLNYSQYISVYLEGNGFGRKFGRALWALFWGANDADLRLGNMRMPSIAIAIANIQVGSA